MAVILQAQIRMNETKTINKIRMKAWKPLLTLSALVNYLFSQMMLVGSVASVTYKSSPKSFLFDGTSYPVKVYLASYSWATIDPSSSSNVMKAQTGFVNESYLSYLTYVILCSTALILSYFWLTMWPPLSLSKLISSALLKPSEISAILTDWMLMPLTFSLSCY